MAIEVYNKMCMTTTVIISTVKYCDEMIIIGIECSLKINLIALIS